MSYHSNLRTCLTSFTLLPGLLCALLLGSYLIYALHRDVSHLGQANGIVLGEQVSHLAYDAVQQRDLPTLDHLALVTLENPLVHAVTVYDSNMAVLSHAGPRHTVLAAEEKRFFDHGVHEVPAGDNRQIILPLVTKRLASELAIARTPPQAGNDPIGWVRIELSDRYLLLNKQRTLFIDIAVICAILAAAFWLTMPFNDLLANTLLHQGQSAMEISRGHHDNFPPETSIYELRSISHGIRSMQRAIHDQHAGLQHYIDQSTKDLRDNLELIEIQNIELSLARREAVQANRIKSEFLANTSHEIRTPLNSIIGFSRLIEKSPLTTQQRDYLHNIQKSSESLLTIINDVLDLSKIEAGKLVLDRSSFDLYDTVEEILQILAPGAHEKGLELLHMIYSDVPRLILGDSLRLKQILTNLIGNAIKFSDQGRVVVRLSLDGITAEHATLKMEVSDTGKGLPNNNHTIFTAFNQLDSSSTREHGGTGLGLAICKKLVEQMGGEIGYHSDPGNTTFWFTFRAELAAEQTEPTQHYLGEHTVLICDREPISRLALSHFLTQWKLHPVMVEQPAQIVPAIQLHADSQKPVDVVLINIPANHTPIDIDTIHQQILAQPSSPAYATILCSPSNSRHNFTELFGSTVLHITKPVTERRLLATLRTALGLEPAKNGFTLTTQVTPETSFTGITVLAVDDNAPNLHLISTILHDMGIRVLAASSGQQAIQLFTTEHCDLVLMDIQMPGMDGIETTQQLRALQTNTGLHTPVIALTAHALAEERRNLLMSGLDDHLSKPATEEQLANTIRKWLWKQPTHPVSIPALENTPSPQPSPLAVDAAAALRNTGNRPAIAADMLIALLQTLPTDADTIHQLVTTAELTTARDAVHRLHGLSGYCGAISFQQACHALETALASMNHQDALQCLPVFMQAAQALQHWQATHNIRDYFLRTG